MNNVASFFIVSISIVTILILGQSLLVPFVFALLLWFIVRGIRMYLDRFRLIRTKFPSWLKNLLASFFILIILIIMSGVISSSINELTHSYKNYETNLDSLVEELNKTFEIDMVKMLKSNVGEFDFGSILSSIFESLTNILSNAFMIVLYALFIFLEEANFSTKLRHAFAKKGRFEQLNEIILRIDQSVTKYLKLKTLVSLMTGGLSYIALLIIGVDSPAFWAFLIFLFNYIPTIGSLLGTLFPAIFCLLQFGEFTPGLTVLAVVGAIQIVIGNIVEPRLMGDSMNVSSLITIVALSLWGAIWGVTGMILSIPITVILIIIFSQFESTRSVAILLSDKGKIE